MTKYTNYGVTLSANLEKGTQLQQRCYIEDLKGKFNWKTHFTTHRHTA